MTATADYRRHSLPLVKDPPKRMMELDRFVKRFKSEDDLRKSLLSLLSRIKDISGIENTHGTQEYGKDIIFYRPGGLGEQRLYACVIKNTKISGTVDANRGARTILQQAQQAFDTPHTNGKGEEEHVDHVYVITPHECSQSALNSIKGSLQARSGQVTFYCGYKLLDLFKDYWPDFIIFDSDLMGGYISSLKQGLNQDSALANLIARHSILSDAPDSFKRIYVQPRFHQIVNLHVVSPFMLPRLTRFDEPFTKAEITEIRRGMQNIGETLQRLQPWIRTLFKTEIAYTVTNIVKLDGLFATEWNSSYESYRSPSGPTQAEPRQPRNSASIGLRNPEVLKKLLEPIRRKTEGMIEDFDILVERANDFVRSSHDDKLSLLQLPTFVDHCAVHELSRLFANLIEARSEGDRFEYPENLLAKYYGPLLITGSAGFGKTSFCKWHSLNDIEAYAKGTSDILPVYIPLHQLSHGHIGNFEETFFRSPELRSLLKSSNNHKGGRLHVRLYLDALDEVPSPRRQRELSQLAQRGSSVCEVQIIITSRDHVTAPWLLWLPRIQLSPLSETQIRNLVANWLRSTDTTVNSFFAELETVSSLKQLMEVPLLATLIVAVYRKFKTLPENKLRLYDMFIELLSGGWDLVKGIQRESKFGSRAKISLLTRLAGLIHTLSEREFSEVTFRLAMKNVLPGLLDQWPAFLEEIVQDGLLVRIGNKYAFAHLSFQEYLAARDLADPAGKRQTQTVKRFLQGDDWWREVLSFYIGMSGRPHDVESWLIRCITTNSLKEPSDFGTRIRFLRSAITGAFPGYRFQQENW